ncbi:MAG: LptF/LptG family permease [Endomicrobium sp.]|jgi:lipopolysaccharide export system permease protein|nr:LptF/LptG family permease [Endomicrobium sp.]
MKILYKYIIKNFAKIFLFTTAVFALVGLITGLFEKMDFYMKHKAPPYLMLIHILSNLPWWLMQALPISTLLALLFSLGNLSKKNEITAIKSAGINIWWITALFIMLGFVIGLGDFSVREFIVPETSVYNEIISKELIQKEKITPKTEFSNLIVSTPNNKRFTIGYLDTYNKTMKNIVMEAYNDEFAIEYLVLAEMGVFEKGTWILKNGVMRNFDNNFWKEIYFENYDSNLHIKPEDMTIQNIKYDAMNTRAFKKYINQLRLFGQIGVKERYALIALNIRYAAVFSHIVVMMIGIPFTLGPGKKLNKILSFTLAMFAAFIYWGTQAITKSLGDNFTLSPFMASWIPNFIFTAIGVYLIVKTSK